MQSFALLTKSMTFALLLVVTRLLLMPVMVDVKHMHLLCVELILAAITNTAFPMGLIKCVRLHAVLASMNYQ